MCRLAVPFSVIIGHVAFNISFVAIVVRARLATMDNTLEEAANDLYANQLAHLLASNSADDDARHSRRRITGLHTFPG